MHVPYIKDHACKTIQLEQKSQYYLFTTKKNDKIDCKCFLMAGVEVQTAYSSAKISRRSFTREFKLSAIQWFHAHDKNILQTALYHKVG
jgi:hypothetical protein